MIWGGTRFIATLAAAALAMTLFNACGGSDSAPSGTATSAASGKAGGATSQKQSSESSQSAGSGEKGGDGSGSGGGSSSVAAPLKVSGGGAAQFRVKGGDNSIQTWGRESGESELRDAAEAVHTFYVARAEEDWQKACTFLAESVVAQLRRFAERSPQLKDSGCGALLETLTGPMPASSRRESTIVNAGSLRLGDKYSFLIYYGQDHAAYGMPLEDEGGAWKLILLSGNPLG